MSKKPQKVFLILDGDGELMCVVLAPSRRIFENRCKKAGFEILEDECCGDEDGGEDCEHCEHKDCECKKQGFIHIPADKFVPVSKEDLERALEEAEVIMPASVDVDITLLKAWFGNYPIIMPDFIMKEFDGATVAFVEIDPVSP